MKQITSITLYLILFSIIVLSPVNLAAQSKEKTKWPSYGRIGLNYTYEENTTQQFNLCAMGFSLTDRLIVETPILGISRIVDDPYNLKGNYSFVPLAVPLIIMASLADSGNAHSNVVKAIDTGLFGVHCALNSTLFYTVTGRLIKAKDSQTNQVIISPFIKNETDWFIIRDTDWLQISPGAGIRVYVGKAAGLNFSPGYQKSFQTDFKGHWKQKDMMFFNIGFDVDFDAGMSV